MTLVKTQTKQPFFQPPMNWTMKENGLWKWLLQKETFLLKH